MADDVLVQRLPAYVAAETPALAHGRAVLAVSGGADSIATAALLCQAGIVRPHLSMVAHFDHRLRGPDAGAADRAAVDALCGRYGLKLETGAWDEPSRGEGQARHARYRFLTGVARRRRIDVIVTGHTSDDQVETVIMRALRGAGLHGLRGIAPQRVVDGALTLARPMLCVSRAETRAYCAANGLTYYDDTTNDDRTYLRNRIRLDLLPSIAATTPGARGALLRLAAEARESVAAIEAVAASALAAASTAGHDGSLRLSRGHLLAMRGAVRPYVWRLAIERLLGDAREFDRRHYSVMARAADASTGATFELPRGVRITVDADAVIVSRGSIVQPAIPEDASWTLPCAGVVGAWRISVLSAAAHSAPESIALPPRAVVRGRRPGDRIQPRGMRGHKKLQDYYVDRKVPRRERDAAPVIACGGDVLWTPFGQAEPVDGGAQFEVSAERVDRSLT
jgi:tRNA(Ile)-lysidine synthase